MTLALLHTLGSAGWQFGSESYLCHCHCKFPTAPSVAPQAMCIVMLQLLSL